MAHVHNVHIDNDNANLLRWGNLVVAWIKGTQPLPQKVKDLNDQMTNARVRGKAEGGDNRRVDFPRYPVGQAVVIPLPDPTMMDADTQSLIDSTHNGTNSAPYPLPTFYSVCFGGAPPAQLSLQELKDMQARRIGEYVINECM
jgi:hypothetical protein